MAFLNPKKWSIACWAVLLLWLYPSVLMNLPLEPTFDPSELGGTIGTLPDGTVFASYDHTALIGWPFCYLEIAAQGSKPPTRTFNPIYAVVNLALVALTLLGIVLTFQTWILQFSIRTMFIAMTGLALLIVIGQAVFSTDSYNLQTGYMMALYFLPLIAGLTSIIYAKSTRSRRIGTA